VEFEPMIFNFDDTPDRRKFPGTKWGRHADRDVIPLWVADMDFVAPSPVLEALRDRIAHGIFGYTDPWPSLIEAVVEGVKRDHGWDIEPNWLVWLPGVVTGLNVACRAVGTDGAGVFSATPIYPPFFSAPANNARRLVQAPLALNEERWEWDRLTTVAALDSHTRLFMLCNPHNPVGRVFDEEELRWIGGLAIRRDLVICSDEIHCGLVLDKGKRHLPIAALDQEIARRTITLIAPSKTWNIPALYCAIAIIPDPRLRVRYQRAMRGVVPQVNVLGLVAAEAAYRDGGPWRDALLDYLRGNRDRVMDVVKTIPGLSMIAPEATYLAWIDCRDAGLDEDPAAFFEHAGVELSDGRHFGMPGFVRLNFGCARATLDEALARMVRAFRLVIS
jgi:cystathionine beta-lyase